MRRLAALALALAACNSSPATGGGDGGGADGNGNCAPLTVRPQARQRIDAVLLPAALQVLVYGGDGAPTSSMLPAPRQLGDDLWSFDLACSTWTQLGAQQPPGALGEYAAALDSKRNRMVVIAGQKGTTKNPPLSTEIWAYDVAGKTWAQLHPTPPAGGAPPSARVGHRAVYDAAGDRVIIFGGEGSVNFSAGDMLGDTWALEFAAAADGAWRALANGPSKRRDGALAIDGGGRVVLFGGASDFQTYQNDVWVLTPSANAWKQATVAGTAPSPRFAMKMSFDESGNRFLLFGGHDPMSLGVMNDTWSLTVDAAGANATFTPLLAGDTDITVAGVDHLSPERRERHGQALGGGKLWIFGGASDCGPMDDAWTLDLASPTTWTPVVHALIDETCQRRAMPTQMCQPPPNDCTTPL
jgi:N-acetylneuraminic acid mutarotase